MTKESFSTYRQTGIVLQVNSNPEINVTLQIGAVTQTVEVDANVAMVETTSNAVFHGSREPACRGASVEWPSGDFTHPARGCRSFVHPVKHAWRQELSHGGRNIGRRKRGKLHFLFAGRRER